MKTRCLYCYRDLKEEGPDFHKSCSRKIFGSSIPPTLDYSREQMYNLAEKIIQSQFAVTGVQPKLSLGLKDQKEMDSPPKLTILGLWNDYILKPPSREYPNLPELEDLSMHLAEIAGIKTVPHSLIRLKSGELAYLTRRIDRQGKRKLHMEDMCQITEKMTESKYRGSHEQIAKAIQRHSSMPGLDTIGFFEQVVYCFLTGNNDMHLKNFSLFKDPERGYILSPAYDLVAAVLVVEGDDEELALTLNGKKKKLRRRDFEEAMKSNMPSQKTIENIFNRFKSALHKWHEFVEISFLPDKLKEDFHQRLDSKSSQLEL